MAVTVDKVSAPLTIVLCAMTRHIQTRRRPMMKERKLLCALVVFAGVAWTGSASAQHLVDTPLVCNTADGVNFGVASTASGAVKITSKGKLTLTMRGLPAGERAECELDCTQAPTSTHLAPCGH